MRGAGEAVCHARMLDRVCLGPSHRRAASEVGDRIVAARADALGREDLLRLSGRGHARAQDRGPEEEHQAAARPRHGRASFRKG